MIHTIRGELISLEPFFCIVEANQIGFGIHIPLYVSETLRADSGKAVLLHVSAVYREESQELFGFLEKSDRDLFNTLKSLSGIGPKQSMAILSALGPAGTVNAIVEQDKSALIKVPGVGAQRAEKILFEGNQKKKTLLQLYEPGKESGSSIPSAAVAAMVSLGYREKEIDQSAQKLLSSSGDIPSKENIQEWIRKLLQNI